MFDNTGDSKMSEITKLYDNAKIAPKRCSECDNNMDCGYGKGCYPPFTAEKQIEIVKFLLAKDVFKCYQHYTSKAYIVLIDDVKDFICNKPFDEFLASYINYLWLSLTEKEKQQIKEILEC